MLYLKETEKNTMTWEKLWRSFRRKQMKLQDQIRELLTRPLSYRYTPMTAQI